MVGADEIGNAIISPLWIQHRKLLSVQLALESAWLKVTKSIGAVKYVNKRIICEKNFDKGGLCLIPLTVNAEYKRADLLPKDSVIVGGASYTNKNGHEFKCIITEKKITPTQMKHNQDISKDLAIEEGFNVPFWMALKGEKNDKSADSSMSISTIKVVSVMGGDNVTYDIPCITNFKPLSENTPLILLTDKDIKVSKTHVAPTEANDGTNEPKTKGGKKGAKASGKPATKGGGGGKASGEPPQKKSRQGS